MSVLMYWKINCPIDKSTRSKIVREGKQGLFFLMRRVIYWSKQFLTGIIPAVSFPEVWPSGLRQQS